MAGSVREVEVLSSKSEKFMNLASICSERRLYDLACFNAQQGIQLLLKAFALKKLGYVPRTHSTRELMGSLATQTDAKELSEYVKSHRLELTVLEDAYVSSRYFVKEFAEEDAQDCIRIAKGVADLVQRTIRDP